MDCFKDKLSMIMKCEYLKLNTSTTQSNYLLREIFGKMEDEIRWQAVPVTGNGGKSVELCKKQAAVWQLYKQ